MKLILYIIPIIVHISLLPVHFIDGKTGYTGLVEAALGIIIIPVYLTIVSLKFTNRVCFKSYILQLLIMFVVSVIGNIISYVNWGISSGNLLCPDSETVLLIRLQIITALSIIVVIWSLVCMVMKIKNYR